MIDFKCRPIWSLYFFSFRGGKMDSVMKGLMGAMPARIFGLEPPLIVVITAAALIRLFCCHRLCHTWSNWVEVIICRAWCSCLVAGASVLCHTKASCMCLVVRVRNWARRWRWEANVNWIRMQCGQWLNFFSLSILWCHFQVNIMSSCSAVTNLNLLLECSFVWGYGLWSITVLWNI